MRGVGDAELYTAVSYQPRSSASIAMMFGRGAAGSGAGVGASGVGAGHGGGAGDGADAGAPLVHFDPGVTFPTVFFFSRHSSPASPRFSVQCEQRASCAHTLQHPPAVPFTWARGSVRYVSDPSRHVPGSNVMLHMADAVAAAAVKTTTMAMMPELLLLPGS